MENRMNPGVGERDHVQKDMSPSCPPGYDGAMAGVRDRLERGVGMRVQRLVEGSLILVAILLAEPAPAYVAFALLAAQVVTPVASPVALAWQLVERRLWRALRPARLGDLYYDLSATRGAAAISCTVMVAAYLLVEVAGLPTVGWILLAAPGASCILSATVGFCAGCGYFVLGRDLLVKAGVVRGTPEGATDVDIQRD